MMKQLVRILPLLFFCTINISTQSMESLTQVVPTCIDYAISLGIPLYLVHKDRTEFITAPSAQQEVEAFVIQQLTETYPELKASSIKVVCVSNLGFAAATYNNIHYISIPESLTDNELKKAYLYQKNNLTRFTPEEIQSKSERHNITPEAFIACATQQGNAMNAQTLTNWKSTLSHEGSHLLHTDSKNKIAFLCLSMAIAHGGIEMAKHYLIDNNTSSWAGIFTTITLAGAKLGITALLNAACNYHQEYRADQDAIARTDDHTILEAKCNHFEHLPDNGSALDRIINLHPSHAARAAYFKEAAQKLANKK